MHRALSHRSGFTLIELSIVLVIIGLIVGGVLVGRDLIRAAEVRAQISQIEKYQTAVNTFRTKYNNELPGDILAADAVMFGLSPSVASRTWSGVTYGNGDGILQSLVVGSDSIGTDDGGETSLFWMDLSTTGLISEAPTNCDISEGGCSVPARLGQANVIYVMSGGYNGGGPTWSGNGVNYYGMSTALTYIGGGWSTSNPGLTVGQAYAIDKKVDDGLPQTGHVIAAYLNVGNPNGYGSDYGAPVWVNPGGTSVTNSGITTAATAGSSATCYDNGNMAGAAQQYSVGQNGGTNVNCALSFQFQ